MRIEIVVDEDGTVRILTKGFKGPSCIKEVEKLLKLLEEEGLDTETLSLKKTPEYYEKEEAEHEVKA